jgi:hypothetical protein
LYFYAMFQKQSFLILKSMYLIAALAWLEGLDTVTPHQLTKGKPPM